MRIKQLEITGFKSFVDRTTILFDQDVIGIVGPNGCGKSNIVDALRWCIGEQSAKHLRGKAMSDVIFAGSESRGPMGMAEVTITFVNNDPEAALAMPIEYRDYSEIAVTRRLYRDGTSEYEINKTQVRLKDITDLFLGTGVGTKAYSIVEQGKIGLIVSARPEDRRLLIEEAAGITKYKHRRKQTEQKMELTRQNLARIGDIVTEIERSLASLKRQAQKAERYRAYKSEHEDLILHESSHRFLDLTVRGRVEQEALAEATDGADQARAQLDVREAELEAARTRAFEREERSDHWQREAFAATAEVRGLEAEIDRSRDRLVSLTTRENQAEKERADLAEQVAAVAAEREALAQQLDRGGDAERLEVEAILLAQEKLDALRNEETLASRALTDLRSRASQAAARVASTEARLTASSRRVVELQNRREKMVFENDTLQSERTTLDARRDELIADVAGLLEQKEDAATRRLTFETDLKASREESVALDRTLDVAKNELSQRRNRLRALEEVQRRLEGVGVGPRHLVASKDPVVLGLVADFVEAPRELSLALGGLLGERLQDVVVSDLGRGIELLSELGQAKKGRAAVLDRQHPHAPSGAAEPSGEGVLGPLLARLRFSPENEDLVRGLVGDAILVETIEAARQLAERLPGRPLVTLDGAVLSAGRVVGGAADAVAAGMLEQHREMRELTEYVQRETVVVEEQTARSQALKQRVTDLGLALDRARQDAHQSEIAHVTAEKDLRRAEEQVMGASRRLDALTRDLRDIEDQLAEAVDEQSDAREALDEARTQIEGSSRELQDAEAVVEGWRERVMAQQAAVTEQKVRVARLREQTSGLRTTVERLGRSVDDLMGRIRRLADELLDGARQAGRAAGALFASKERLGDAVLAAQDADRELVSARRLFDEARGELGERENGLRDLRARVSKLTEGRTKHQFELERLVVATTHLLEGVREKFRGLDLRRVIGDYHARPMVDDTHRARITELGQLIDRMGPVNLDAVREYEEADKRFVFYTTQRADLEGALADLVKAIDQIDKQSRKLFRETFDSVNTKFQAMFPRMFRGGEARLQLTGADDLLEAGVEILAQPPGKRLVNIELMSGGEKALTAVSLIFAMFQHRPSPFCVLDEVDAPLDEANVARYNEAIRTMTDQSQFILITHIKRTMQSVDALYGVTMQEPGVSRLVSVKVHDAAAKVGKPGSVAVA